MGDAPRPTSEHADQMIGIYWPGTNGEDMKTGGLAWKTGASKVDEQAEAARTAANQWTAAASGEGFDRIYAFILQMSNYMRKYSDTMRQVGNDLERIGFIVQAAKTKIVGLVAEGETLISAARTKAEAEEAAGDTGAAARLAAETAEIIAKAHTEIVSAVNTQCGLMPTIPALPPSGLPGSSGTGDGQTAPPAPTGAVAPAPVSGYGVPTGSTVVG